MLETFTILVRKIKNLFSMIDLSEKRILEQLVCELNRL